MSYLSESGFQDHLLSLLAKDRLVLKQCEHVLTPEDFSADKRTPEGRSRLIVGKLALEHYRKYREPAGTILKADALQYCKKQHIEGATKAKLIDLVDDLLRKKVNAAESIVDKVIDYKKEQLKKLALQKIYEAQEKGELDDDLWIELTRGAVQPFQKDRFRSVDYFQTLKDRIRRRKLITDSRYPLLLIDDLDAQVRAIPRGCLGLLLAPYKRGKSLALLHITVAYCLQRLKGIHITLEDPETEVEDRLDAAIAQLPIRELNDRPKSLRKRFSKFQRYIHGGLKLVDGTDSAMTVQDVEDIYDDFRNKGFTADFIVIDYDEELRGSKKYGADQRRFEFDDIYRGLRRLAAKKGIFIWTAAQTKRATSDKKVLTGDDISEDISKVKKAAMAISIGQGEWGPDSLYLHVAAHKFDKKFRGCNIIPDMDRMLFYDRLATLKEKAKYAATSAAA